MRRGQRNAQFASSEHHYHLCGAGFVREKLRVAREGNSRIVDNRFLYGRGHHRLESSLPAALNGAAQHCQHIRRVGGIQGAGGDRRGERYLHDTQGAGRVLAGAVPGGEGQ